MDYNDIKHALKTANLAQAFPALRRQAASVGDWTVADEIETLWNTYRQMMQFMLNGVEDKQSHKIRQKLCQDLLLATYRLERKERMKNCPTDKYVSSRKEMKGASSFKSLADSLEDVSQRMARLTEDPLLKASVKQHNMALLEAEHETIMQNLFKWVWTSELWQSSDTELSNRIIFSDNISEEDKAVFISAVTLSVFEYTDTTKVLFLLDSFLVESRQVAQRALVGFVLSLCMFFDELKDSADLHDRLVIYRDDDTFVGELFATMMQLQLSAMTDRITSKMRNDILPTIMQGQLNPQKGKSFMSIQSSKKEKFDMSEFMKNGENPEWMDQAEVDKKLQEMTQLQQDGADIYFSSFCYLKNYDFFQQVSHWFYPFSYNHLPQEEQQKFGQYVRLLLCHSPFCNSDKYSFCLTLNNFGFDKPSIWGGGKEGASVESILKSQLDGTDIEEHLSDLETSTPNARDIRKQYIFDIYRFFNLYPYKQQFKNPFDLFRQQPLTPSINAWIAELLADRHEDLERYAEFLMHNGFYAHALQLFTALPSNEFEPQYASIWQKIGFCQQKMSLTDEAIHSYSIANSLKPNSKWTLIHLASLCLSAEATETKTEAAVKWYKELLGIEPDNTKYITNLTQALMLCDKYEEAEKYAYKASYLDKESSQIRHILNWCLLVNGALTELPLADQKDETDEGRMLHILACLVHGDRKRAYEGMILFKNEKRMELLRKRLRVLVSHKRITEHTATLFYDAVSLSEAEGYQD